MNNQSPTLTLPFKHWPEPDRVRWLQSRICNAPFGIQSPAATWSPARVRMVEDAYGQWLAWFEARGELDVELAERVTVDRVEAYVGAMRKRIAPVSVAMMVGNLGRMMAVIYPGKDWAWLRNIYQYLKVNAVPVRDKRQSIVPALDLYNLGLDLMQHADKIKHHTFFNAAIYRDGLIISLLAASALRLANLSSITIGTQLTCHDGEYWLHFPEEETKNSRPIDLVLPNSLVPYIEQYLQHHRRVLLDRRIDKTVAPARRLWVNRAGLPMAASAIRAQIKSRTEHAFGRPVWPHLFRACAATSWAIEKPNTVTRSADLLGHANYGTTEKYYIQAGSLESSRRYQKAMLKVRASKRSS